MKAESPSNLVGRVRTLRESFDAAFARPPAPPPPQQVAVLLLRTGGELVAVKRSDMAGLTRAENIAPTPGNSPAFVGLAGLRGALYPVWDLAALLGRSDSPREQPAGWLVLAAARPEAPCAFLCEGFERMVLVAEADLATRDGTNTVISWGTQLVPLIDLVALQAAIHGRKDSNSSGTLP